MISRILIAALAAGVLAGLFATVVQAWRVTPLILEAERYESASPAAHSHDPSHAQAHDHGAAAGEGAGVATQAQGGEAAEPWAPADGFERTAYTALANVGIGIAFAMILTAAALLLNVPLTARNGLALGVCGFIAFVLAPNFGLPPELPGMQAAGLAERQIWWVATVAATAAALAIFAFRRHWYWIAVGLALIAAPHLYGAPQPLSHESDVPANLAADFAIATMVSSALFWLFLGAVLGALAHRMTGNRSSNGASNGAGKNGEAVA
ncbi:MAG: CbtA family protein [Nitratireductor sp.]|nr:CbtA family protein [Nitratireductor sp.]